MEQIKNLQAENQAEKKCPQKAYVLFENMIHSLFVLLARCVYIPYVLLMIAVFKKFWSNS